MSKQREMEEQRRREDMEKVWRWMVIILVVVAIAAILNIFCQPANGAEPEQQPDHSTFCRPVIRSVEPDDSTGVLIRLCEWRWQDRRLPALSENHIKPRRLVWFAPRFPAVPRLEYLPVSSPAEAEKEQFRQIGPSP